METVARAEATCLLLVLLAALSEAFVLQPGFRRVDAPRRQGISATRMKMELPGAESKQELENAGDGCILAAGSVVQSRRHALGMTFTLGLIQGLLAPGFHPAFADEEDAEEEEEEEVAAAAEITDRLFIDLKVAGVNSASASNRGSNLERQAADEGRLVIGLYGKEAPEATQMFKDLFAGSLAAVCKDVTLDAAIQRELLQKKQPVKQCKAAESKPVDLVDSTIWRIIENERIDFGRLKGKFMLRQAPNTNDSNSLKHDRAGVLSTKKGGGVFEFSVAPGANPKLDASNVVFGQVLQGMSLIEKLNRTPVKKYAGNLGESEDASATDAGCYYGSKVRVW